MFEHIVVAVDGSVPAKRALFVGCVLASKYGSEVHLDHSPQLETAGIAVGSGVAEIKPDANNSRLRAAEPWKRRRSSPLLKVAAPRSALLAAMILQPIS